MREEVAAGKVVAPLHNRQSLPQRHLQHCLVDDLQRVTRDPSASNEDVHWSDTSAATGCVRPVAALC